MSSESWLVGRLAEGLPEFEGWQALAGGTEWQEGPEGILDWVLGKPPHPRLRGGSGNGGSVLSPPALYFVGLWRLGCCLPIRKPGLHG